MGKSKGQPLICSENLSIPSFQEIVVEANMSCNSCRERVFQLMSKMNGVKEFTVDVTRNQVMIKGRCKIPTERPKYDQATYLANSRGNKKFHTMLN